MSTSHYPRPLTERQRRFVDAYIETGNATQSAITAGFSATRAHVTGAELVANRKIASELAARQSIIAKRNDITIDRLIREYARIAFADMRHFVQVKEGVSVLPSSEWTDDDAAAVAEVSETTTKEGGSLRFKLHSKTDALEALGKHLGMFPRGDINVNIDARQQVLGMLAGMTTEQLLKLAEPGTLIASETLATESGGA